MISELREMKKEMSAPLTSPHILNIAHRGARSLAPENTLAAARKGLEAGADMWELDIQITADGELIVIHDTTLKRTSNVREVFPNRKPWLVHEFTLDEIRLLDFGSWFRKQDPFGQIAAGMVAESDLASYVHQQAPTLKEALTFTLDAGPTEGATGRACRVRNTVSGQTYTGLQAAVNAAQRGDKLAVRGTCAGHTSIGKRLTIVGERTERSGGPQLTGRNNYAKMQRRFRTDLTSSDEAADRALEPGLAAKIMFHGMEKGMFTGKSLADYFTDNQSDWVKARAIINPGDKAKLVAGYARDYFAALEAASR